MSAFMESFWRVTELSPDTQSPRREGCLGTARPVCEEVMLGPCPEPPVCAPVVRASPGLAVLRFRPAGCVIEPQPYGIILHR